MKDTPFSRLVLRAVVACSLAGSGISADILDGHFTEVRRLHFSPDGARLLSHSRDHTVIIWDVKGKKPLTTLRIRALRDVIPLPGNVQFLLIHRRNQLLDWDGRITEAGAGYSRDVLAVFPGGISLRRGEEKTELVSGERVIAVLETRGRGVHCLSADGKHMAVSKENAILVHSLPDMKQMRSIPVENPPQACAFTPDGKRLAVVEFESVSLWSVESREQKAEVSARIDTHYGDRALFSPDGKLLALPSGNRIAFWDLQVKEMFRMDSADGISRFNSFAFSPGGKAASGTDDGLISVERVSEIRSRDRQARKSEDYKPGFRETMDKLEKDLGLACEKPPCDVCEKGNCKNGTGTMRYNKWGTYTGGFKDGKRHGKGEFKDTDSRTVATWKDDKKTGPGEIFHSGGAKTIMSWTEDKPEGAATTIGRNGDEVRTVYRYGEVVEGYGAERFRGAYYYGTWKNGMPHGSGRIVTENSILRYEGLFLDGYPAEEAKLQLVARIVDSGVFSSETQELREDFGKGEPGSRSTAARVRFTEQTKTIPARLGARFGIRILLSGVPQNATIPLRVVISRPGAKTVHTIYETAGTEHLEALAGFVLRHPEELAPGTWTFEVFNGETMLAKQNFLLTQVRP